MRRTIRIMPACLLPALLFASLASAQARLDDDGSATPGVARAITIDTTSLASSTVAAFGALSKGSIGAPVLQARAQLMRPAPLPDQDYDAPGPSEQALAAQDQASVSPSLVSPSRHFSGDGFASGSTLDEDRVNRHRAGGGMSLSIPMQ